MAVLTPALPQAGEGVGMSRYSRYATFTSSVTR